jgi:hypothetical protein
LNASAAVFHGFVGDVPGAAVDDQGRFQGCAKLFAD